MKNSVVVGGLGVVGKATCTGLHIDKYWDLKGDNCGWDGVLGAKYLFLCLPTPASDVGHNITYTEGFISMVEAAKPNKDRVYIIRSTTTPGQVRDIAQKLHVQVIHFPEFLTMSTQEDDAIHPDIVVIGYENQKIGEEFLSLIRSEYGDGPKYFTSNLETSELIKVAINNFYALKVVFANEMFDFANRVGADWDKVKEAMYARKWVGTNHLDVIFNGKRGVRGPCLPKELRAMAGATKSPLLITALEINNRLLGINND